MKKSYLVATALAVCVGCSVTSCGSNPSSANETGQHETAIVETKSAAWEVDSLLVYADSLAGRQVVVEGVCTHICQHGGGKIFLMGSDDTQTIRVDAGEKIGKFPQETVNSLVRIHGTVVEERIDEAFLSRWEAELDESESEVGHAGGSCESDQKARGETPVNSVQERIDNFRKRIAERYGREGKNYLSFYSVRADRYEIL